jgi:hypothetical protein
MTRDGGRDLLRSEIAHLAARLMAEDGIEDYALAKRKAARQLGAGEPRRLPDNDEIDAALAEYRAIYQRDSHPGRLRQLREIALEVMASVDRFDPHLVGPVLRGSAGKFADIELQLFADSAKAVELHLLAQGIAYRAGSQRLYAGDQERVAPTFTLEHDGVPVELTVLLPNDQRLPVRTRPAGRPIERARADAVAALIAAG